MAAQGTAGRFVFPRPMTDRPGLDFSFSGLKTFAANTIRDNGTDDQTRAAASCLNWPPAIMCVKPYR